MPITKKTIIKEKKVAIDKPKPLKEKKDRYFESVGRRKTAIARVRLYIEKEQSFSVNDKPFVEYFPTKELQKTISSPLDAMNLPEQFKVSVRVKGGGISSQAEAVRHGITRALVLFDPESRKTLKKAGFLKRDPRMRERKKFGLKRARKAPQWAKR